MLKVLFNYKVNCHATIWSVSNYLFTDLNAPDASSISFVKFEVFKRHTQEKEKKGWGSRPSLTNDAKISINK